MIDGEAKMPNVITPNGDGKNQAFAPRVTCLPISLKVYNRWGKLVYEQDNYQNTWDGGNLPADVYYYQLSTNTGLSWKGWVQIMKAGKTSL